jgi:hypothetical protein
MCRKCDEAKSRLIQIVAGISSFAYKQRIGAFPEIERGAE